MKWFTKKEAVNLEKLAKRIEEEVYESFPLLRPVVDLEGERNWAEESPAWRSFLDLRDNVFANGEYPDSGTFDLERFISLSSLWFKDFQREHGVLDEIRKLWDGKALSFYDDHYRLVQNQWLTEWRSLLDRYVPNKYRPYFDDREGVVSVSKRAHYKLFNTRPNPQGENHIWRMRRFWARRDWFLTHLAMILDIYSQAFNLYPIGIKLDKYLSLDSESFMSSSFSKEYGLPARCLNWKGEKVFLHTDWHDKTLPALLWKVLLKRYNGYPTLYQSIYDILRGHIAVEEEKIPIVCDFIEEVTGLKRVEEKVNPYSSDAWKVFCYKGLFNPGDNFSKFEFQVQSVDNYLASIRSAGPENHLSYKGRQAKTLILILQPWELLQASFHDSDSSSGDFFSGFADDYQRLGEKLVRLESQRY